MPTLVVGMNADANVYPRMATQAWTMAPVRRRHYSGPLVTASHRFENRCYPLQYRHAERGEYNCYVTARITSKCRPSMGAPPLWNVTPPKR